MEMNAEQPKVELGQDQPEADLEAPQEGASFEASETKNQGVEVAAPAASSVAAPQPVIVPKDETTAKVEKVLEEGLSDAYRELSPPVRAKFKNEGERVTREIVGMVASMKVQAGKVLNLITKWLRIIPGINKFFLSQEAKIKTDRVVALGDEEKAKRGMTI